MSINIAVHGSCRLVDSFFVCSVLVGQRREGRGGGTCRIYVFIDVYRINSIDVRKKSPTSSVR